MKPPGPVVSASSEMGSCVNPSSGHATEHDDPMALVKLANSLTNGIANSGVSVTSWSADPDKLVLRITKATLRETGLLRLTRVGLVHLPPSFVLAGVAAYDCAFPDFPDLALGNGEIAVAFQDADGRVHLVTAGSTEYEIVD